MESARPLQQRVSQHPIPLEQCYRLSPGTQRHLPSSCLAFTHVYTDIRSCDRLTRRAQRLSNGGREPSQSTYELLRKPTRQCEVPNRTGAHWHVDPHLARASMASMAELDDSDVAKSFNLQDKLYGNEALERTANTQHAFTRSVSYFIHRRQLQKGLA